MRHKLGTAANVASPTDSQGADMARFTQLGGNTAWAERLTADVAGLASQGGDVLDLLGQHAGQAMDGLQNVLHAGGDLLQRVLGRGTGDIAREGTLSHPTTGDAIDVTTALGEAEAAGARPGEWLMDRYAFQPSGERTVDEEDRTLRILVPGLNTPEPEASRRTQLYADKLGQPMVHLHNGTNLDATIPGADKLDYAAALATRTGLKDTPLMESLVEVMGAALGQAEPENVHAILYSDATIGGTRAIAQVRENLIRARKAAGSSDPAGEVDALLDEHLFVELHGNATNDLPVGPRYAAWTDREDGFTHARPLPFLPEVGVSGAQPDADANALYLDYDGPFGGVDAHNLAAGGVSAVRETWAANDVESTQELFELFRAGQDIQIPEQVPGDASELWDQTSPRR